MREIQKFVTSKWEKFSFFGGEPAEASKPAKNPKRRAREAAKALKRPAVSTKAQQALAAQREAMKRESAQARSQRRADEAETRFEQRKLKRKRKHRGIDRYLQQGKPYTAAAPVPLEADAA